jgi:hypothetical protein
VHRPTVASAAAALTARMAALARALTARFSSPIALDVAVQLAF